MWKEATELLKELYNTLSYGCNYWIFTSDDPFRSVQIDQCNFLDAVISRKLREGMTEVNLKYCIDVVINSIEKDEEILKYVLFKILEEYDLKEEWIAEYESSVKRIKLRASLQKTYTCLKNNNTWGN